MLRFTITVYDCLPHAALSTINYLLLFQCVGKISFHLWERKRRQNRQLLQWCTSMLVLYEQFKSTEILRFLNTITFPLTLTLTTILFYHRVRREHRDFFMIKFLPFNLTHKIAPSLCSLHPLR
jgi:hypothetical protein